MGVAFECPVHRNHYLGAWFANPIDGRTAAPSEDNPKPRWQRTGDTFETLTLSPSVDASMNCECGKLKRDEETKPEDLCLLTGPGHTPCWHGHIENGEIK